jgi:SAM-dependent methyltransferase
MDSHLFAPETFDAVVMLGALEHFGLGFYGDPIDDDGDTKTMQNIARWLKPGGWVYFDVPCQPTYSVRPNRHFRDYAPASVQERLIAPSG